MEKLPPGSRRNEIAPPSAGSIGRPRPRYAPDEPDGRTPARYQKTFKWKLLTALLLAAGAGASGIAALIKHFNRPDNIGEAYNAVTDGRSHKEQALKQQLINALDGQPRVTLPNGMTVFIDEDNGDTIFAQIVDDDGYFYEMFVHEKAKKDRQKTEPGEGGVWFRSAANRGEGFPRLRVEDMDMEGKNINGSSYETEGQGTPLDPQDAAARFDGLLDFFSRRLSVL